MTYILANYPALTVINPELVYSGVNIQLDKDKGYCRTSSVEITIKSFPRDKYEYIRNFYFGEADGEYFCNPVAACVSTSTKHKATYGYELGDIVKIDGIDFKLLEDSNHNIKLERA